ncbi:MAG: FAD-binding protein [Endomicrobiales bacterium]
MPPIEIAKNLCTLCAVCVKKCPFNALELKEGAIAVNEKCTACGICVKACPEKAMTLQAGRRKKPAARLEEYRGVWVFIEHSQCRIASVSFELLGAGRALADKLGVELSAVLLGDGVRALAGETAAYGADKTLLIDDPLLKEYRTAAYLAGIAALVKKWKPEIMLFGATTTGRDLAGAVATRLETGLTADCTGLDIDEQTRLLKQTRPAFGGNIMATILTRNHRPQMATVRPRVMKAREKDPARAPLVIEEKLALPEGALRTEILNVVRQTARAVSIEDAQIIVSGGKGMGSAKNFELLEELARATGGTVAGSRKAVEAGWVPQHLQVGQTGKTVRPKIYFACGISGAIQHLVGMQTSDIIIAVNRDPEAPIFKVANYGIVGDILDIVPGLTRSF